MLSVRGGEIFRQNGQGRCHWEGKDLKEVREEPCGHLEGERCRQREQPFASAKVLK